MSTSQNKKVTYIYDRDVGDYSYGQGHVMKPHRIRVAHSLIMHYGLHKHMEVHQAKRATELEMTQFHTDEYINHLKNITPEMVDPISKFQNYQFNLGPDCPVFEGVFDFSSISAGGSLAGASRLNRGSCDIAVNWAGGLHHAKKTEASGFCYVNDIVLAILELLRFHKRVLYIDIDVHHGDGVEEAFYTTDRVMTVSFHKYGEFFPGTGELNDIGVGRGKNHAVNVPLADGIDDWSYKTIFQPIIQAVIEYYRPEAIVLQCGADSLSGDRLGSFNLSMDGHAACVEFVKNLNLPLLVLGGGGYNVANTSRAWAYETGVVLGKQQSMKERPMPYHKYYGYFAPEYELDVRPANITNDNSNFYLSKIRAQILENLRQTCTFAPSVPMVDVPRHIQGLDDEADDILRDRDSDEHKDTRRTQYRWEKRIESKDAYISDSDDEEENTGYNIQKQPDRQRQRNIADCKSPDTILDQDDNEEENAGYNIQDPSNLSRQPHITDLTNRSTVSNHGNNIAQRIPSSEDIKRMVAICKARKHRPKFRLPKGATPRK